MITKFGKRFFTNYLAGNVGFAGREIALGIGSTAAADTDSRLNFEFYRIPVEFGSIDIETNDTLSTITARDGVTTIAAGATIYSVIFKGTIPQDVSGQIKEIGLYPYGNISENKFDSKFISPFENNFAWTKVSGDGGTYLEQVDPVSNPGTPTPRIGSYLLKMQDTTSSGPTEYKAQVLPIDLSGYSVNDSITLAYYKEDTNLSLIRIKFYSSDTDYYYVDITPSSGTGNKIDSVNLSGLTSSGTPDNTLITSIGISITASGGTTSIYLDGLRINDEDTFDPIYGIISRTVLTSTLSKVAGRAIEIEYRMALTF